MRFKTALSQNFCSQVCGLSGEDVVGTRWAYPPTKDGMPSGSFCFYCNKTLECHPDYVKLGWSLTQAASELKDEGLAAKWQKNRSRIVDIAAQNGGKVTGTLMDQVFHVTKKASRDTRRGTAMSVTKYRKVTGKGVEGMKVYQKTKRDGREVDYVKVFDNSDSDEWAFSEESAEEIEGRRMVDDGQFKLVENQYEQSLKSSTNIVLGLPVASKSRLSKSGFEKQLEEKRQPPPTAASGSGSSADGLDLAEQDISLMQQLDPMAVRLLGKDRALDQLKSADAKKIAAKAGVLVGKPKKATKPRKALAGLALTRALEATNEAYDDATSLLATVAEAKTADDLKAQEAELKDVTQRLRGKSDVYLDNNDEEKSARTEVLSHLLASASSLLKAWKQHLHAYSGKTFKALEEAYGEAFRPSRLCRHVMSYISCSSSSSSFSSISSVFVHRHSKRHLCSSRPSTLHVAVCLHRCSLKWCAIW